MKMAAVQYLDDWTELSVRISQSNQEKLAPAFFGYAPKHSGTTAGSPILYVLPSAPGYVPNVFGDGPNPLADDPAALDFAGQLSRLAGVDDGSLSNVIVTAFCKVGLMSGEVPPPLISVQQQLAVQTLRLELYAYAPRLVVFACSGQYSYGIREVLNADRGSANDLQKQDDGDIGLATRVRGKEGEPAVLWVQPPSARPASARRAWLDAAAHLLR